MKAAVISLACVMACVFVGREARADDDDDDDSSELDLQNVGDRPAHKRAHRGRPAPRARHHVFVPFPHRRPAPVRRDRVVVFRDRFSDQPLAKERAPSDSGRARGGLLVTGGGARYFGVAPEEGIMPGARLQVAIPVLASATVGLGGGFDSGTSGGVDAQIWRGGLVFAMGAPWTRDFIGVALEGGVLGGHYFDGQTQGIDPRPYGLARLTLQIPLKNDVRPLLAGDLGMTEGTDGRLAGITGIHAGVVWNAW